MESRKHMMSPGEALRKAIMIPRHAALREQLMLMLSCFGHIEKAVLGQGPVAAHAPEACTVCHRETLRLRARSHWFREHRGLPLREQAHFHGASRLFTGSIRCGLRAQICLPEVQGSGIVNFRTF